MEIPATTKFSKFVEQNNKHNRAFCIGLFDQPVHDPDDKPNVVVVGFVFDLMQCGDKVYGPVQVVP